jgi:ABC-type antimicrobial peptide transport system permease subunit
MQLALGFGAIALLLPARRATQVDPIITLNEQ